ncbi:MAG: dethiobiotin synthase [Burkholderiales bacterium]|nr:dethiobiotin synthase [Burkholderiales bacterium]
MRGLFITGTDTGVGKTYVGTAMAAALTARGLRVRARKPVESGCPCIDGELRPEDALAYAAASGEPLAAVCRYRLAAALSPERAARLQGVSYALVDLVEACRTGLAADDLLLVEGAGGFLSPIAPDGLNADLALALGLPVLLVAADRLGAIHQVLVTAEAIQRRGLALAGVVLNEVRPVDDLDMDNAADLTLWLKTIIRTDAIGRQVPLVRLPHGLDTRVAARMLLDRIAELRVTPRP